MILTDIEKQIGEIEEVVREDPDQLQVVDEWRGHIERLRQLEEYSVHPKSVEVTMYLKKVVKSSDEKLIVIDDLAERNKIRGRQEMAEEILNSWFLRDFRKDIENISEDVEREHRSLIN